jgi:DNA repair photolyase
VTVYANAFEKLQHELPRKRRRPAAVYFSPSSDLFQPVPEVLDLGYRMLEYLFAQDVGVAILTKGRIPPRHLDLLVANAKRLHIGIGLTTLDLATWRTFEPNTATPKQRLDQMAALIEAGVRSHQGRLDPILPGITDDQENLRRVMAASKRIGVKRIAFSTAFLRKPIIGSLKSRLGDREIAERILAHYEDGIWTTLRGAGTKALIPSLRTRRAIYQRVLALAREYSLEAHLCACKNADISSDICTIAGNWDHESGAARQLRFV